MAKTRTNEHLQGDLGVVWTELWLLRAGCAINSLAASDYGFDLHVQLPESSVASGASNWPMSPYTILVQVKGGKQTVGGLSVRQEDWELWVATAVPTYLAAFDANGNGWIDAAEALGPSQWASKFKSATVKGVTASPEQFIADARMRALLGSPGIRRWFEQIAPLPSPSPTVQRSSMLEFVEDLAVLDMVGGGAVTLEPEAVRGEVVRILKAAPAARKLVGPLTDATLAQIADDGSMPGMFLYEKDHNGDLTLCPRTTGDAAIRKAFEDELPSPGLATFVAKD